MSIFVRELCLVMFFLGASLTSVQAIGTTITAGQESANSFCKKCHIKEVEDIEVGGMAHQTAVACHDCHPGHKPSSFENIPRCNQCHEGSAHYDQLQCLNCHHNPHQPMQIKLPKKAYNECLACHNSQGDELQQFPSYHSTLVCTDCHYEHGFLPECLSCHKSHGGSMTEESCRNCHAPHKPLELTYNNDVPSHFCSPCHSEANKLLQNSQNKHSQLGCAECHKYQHGVIPVCSDCHGKPHADALHKKFSGCSDCHNTAHSLD